MTPKDKAKELVYKFSQVIPPSKYEAYEDGVKINFDYENAKQCALIAVDEMIEESIGYLSIVRNKYWKKVKREIEKL